MAYTEAQARAQLLESIAQAAEQLGSALASLGEAYEQLDEQSAERLEQQLFRPVQLAYGRAKRTYAEFAARHQMPEHTFESALAGAPSHGVKGFLESALDAVARAEGMLVTLQDSMLPVEVGDPDLRSGLEQVRTLLDALPARAREFTRTLGR